MVCPFRSQTNSIKALKNAIQANHNDTTELYTKAYGPRILVF